MTPAARLSAAIAVLDAIIAGARAEQALATWGRASRFAGSGDRAALRDIVFDVLRAKVSLGRLGGAETGRGLVLGLLRRAGQDAGALFTGEGHAPAPLSPTERAHLAAPVPLAPPDACDIPAWLWPAWQESLGAQAVAAAEVLQRRGPVTLRVNLSRGSRDAAQASLAAEGIDTQPGEVKTALHVTAQERKIARSAAFLSGHVELQDAASQQAVARLHVAPGARVLDYCAGGGGKALAFADLPGVHVTAHDIAPRRMVDLPARAARAGVQIDLTETAALPGLAPFDLVFCDAPCSGSGTWRRTPEAKWALTPDMLHDYARMQAGVLASAAPLVAPGGRLAYATCSVLQAENRASVAGFLAAQPGWRCVDEMALVPTDTQDGFYLAVLARA